MNFNTQILSYEESYHFLSYLTKKNDWKGYLSAEKNAYLLENEQFEKILEFKFPWIFPPIEPDETLHAYFAKLEEELPNYLILLLQAGTGALAYFESGEMENHKVIRRYMIRAKQGKSQIKHLKSKGKSKAGSRVRLAQTLDFFEEINGKIEEWEINDKTHKILYSASIDLWNLVFESKVESVFVKKDKRLRKIPLDLPIPSYENLLEVNELAQQGKLEFAKNLNLDFFNK